MADPDNKSDADDVEWEGDLLDREPHPRVMSRGLCFRADEDSWCAGWDAY